MTGDRLEAAVRELVAALQDEVRGEAAPGDGHDRLLSVDDAADVLGVGRTNLYNALAAGQLRSVKVGRRRLVPQSALDDYIARHAAGGQT